MRYSSRKCACRRGFNSHDAAKPRIPAQRRRLHRSGKSKHRNQHPDFNQGRRERRPVQRHDDAARGGERMRQRASVRLVSARMRGPRSQYESGHQSTGREPRPNSMWWCAPQGAERHAKSLASAADAGYRDCSCCGAEREAESLVCKYNLGWLPCALMPNPSLEARPNIKTPGPRSGLAHFPPRGPGVLLSVPPQLER